MPFPLAPRHPLAGKPLSGSRSPARPRESEGGIYVLYLSVFFLLLAFFILLTSLSTFKKQKAEAVVAGIQDAFGNGDGGGVGLMAQAMARMNVVGQGMVTEIPGAVMAPPVPHGDRLAVDLPLDGLLTADGGGAMRVADAHGPLITGIAAALKGEAGGDKGGASLPLSLEFLAGDGGRDDDDGIQDPVQAAGAVARALVAAGAPVARLTVGVERGRAGWGRFILSVKAPAMSASPAESRMGGRS